MADINLHGMDQDLLKIAAVIAYLLGSIPFGLILTKLAGLGDIRSIGSGSIGATNVLRTGNKRVAAATLLFDALKGAVAVLLGEFVASPDGQFICGIAVVIGHLFPVWLAFRGGKGVATGLGVLIASSPLSGAICCAVWLAMAKLFKISSLAGLTSFAVSPLVVWGVTGSSTLAGMAGVIAVLVFIRHHQNIRRLMAGTEPRIGQR